ncbi:adenylosuccinate lyase-like [Oratosquilla oratoria]|uniref:adenylosuccinate lyase-like n=1 Tax=Oratosquilla oratoria TaxID=337810 RepID=UPI003F758922
MQRNIKRFKEASSEIEIGKISGAVGNFANTPAHLQDLICKELGISSTNISTQTLQRDRHANYMSVLAIIGSTLEKIAIEVRNSQRTEVREMMENFSSGQKGSSAMPHKRNPIASENITGIARVLRGYGKVIQNLVIDEKQMLANINLTQGVVFSQRVLTSLIEKGLSREEAYDIVQPLAIKS